MNSVAESFLRLNYFSPLTLSFLCSALMISFHIKLQSTRVLQCCYSKPKKFNKIQTTVSKVSSNQLSLLLFFQLTK